MRKQALVLAGLMAVSGFAFAQGPAPRAGEQQQQRGPRPAGARLEQRQQQLGLTDAQVEQLRKLHVDQRKAEIQRRAARAVAQMEMNELFQASTVDEKAVAAKLKQLTDLDATGLKARVDARLALRKIVSAEQAEKLERMMARGRRGGDREGLEGRRQGRRPGRPQGRGGEGPEGAGNPPDGGAPEPDAR